MSTIQAPTPTDTTVFVGTVSSPPNVIRLLPDRRAHVSFHLDTGDAHGVNIHVDGSLAELARITIHRRDHVTVTAAKVYRRISTQRTPDVDAKAFDLIPA